MERPRKLKLILTGTGRCATGFYAKFLSSAGMACGHELFFGPWDRNYALRQMDFWSTTWAESSWLAAPHLDDEILSDAFAVHLTRHPQCVIESWLRVPPEVTPTYAEYRYHFLPDAKSIPDPVTRAAYLYVRWNRLIESKLNDRASLTFNIEREPTDLLDELEQHGFAFIRTGELFNNRTYNRHKGGSGFNMALSDVADPALRDGLTAMLQAYGYDWPTSKTITAPTQSIRVINSKPIIKAIVTTLDNLPNLQETVPILQSEPLDQIIIVNNGSQDGTKEWLDAQPDITAIHRQNLGAGPGRNAGLDAAGHYDYIELLDGGIRPLRGGTAQMLDYLERHPRADVIGVEIPAFETDRDKAWRRWPNPIADAYINTRLSHTAYCLARFKAFDDIRFSEEGPFGQPGWGADDDELAYQWNEAGIAVHVVTGVHPYRRASGSFRRLYQETGVWPTQYGSVYEQRVVWLQHRWPQHQPGLQWGEPWLTVVIKANGVERTAKMIKAAHDHLRQRRFKKPWEWYPNPYSIVVWSPDGCLEFSEWSEPRRLRQHHGDTTIVDGQVVKRDKSNEATWTGDFIVWRGVDWQDVVRPNAFWYGLVNDQSELGKLLSSYDAIHPPKLTRLEVPEGNTWPKELSL